MAVEDWMAELESTRSGLQQALDRYDPTPIQHPAWQVALHLNEDGSHDIGLTLVGQSIRMTWQEATVLSVALKVAVEGAMTPGVPADSDPPAPRPAEDPEE